MVRWLIRLWRAYGKDTLICVSVGWFVYQLTTLTALGLMIACFKFGLEDVKTAFWLHRRDPKPERGISLFWFYVAWGFFKVVWLSYWAIFGAATLLAEANRRGFAGDNVGKTQAMLITQASATILAILCGTVAVITAYRHRQRIWLDSAVHKARRTGEWPPSDFDNNRAKDLIGALACGVLLACFILPGFAIPMTMFNGWQEMPGPTELLVCAIVPGVSGLVGVAIGQRIFSALVATTVAGAPDECWKAKERGLTPRAAKEMCPLPGDEGLPPL
jgi:hypothetical protein